MVSKPPGAVYIGSHKEPLDQSDCWKLFVQLWNYTKIYDSHAKKLPSRARHLLKFFFIWQLNSTNERDLLIMLKRNNLRINTRTKQLQRVIQQKCDNNIDFYVTNSMTRLFLAFLLYIIEVKVKLTRPLKAWTFANLVRRLFPNIFWFLVYILPRMEVQTSPKAGKAKQNANSKPYADFGILH